MISLICNIDTLSSLFDPYLNLKCCLFCCHLADETFQHTALSLQTSDFLFSCHYLEIDALLFISIWAALTLASVSSHSKLIHILNLMLFDHFSLRLIFILTIYDEEVTLICIFMCFGGLGGEGCGGSAVADRHVDLFIDKF